VDTLNPTQDDTVLEIGPGRGALTELLLPRVKRLVAVELDRALAALLRERFADDARVTIVENDILEIDPGELAGTGYLLVGNVPYYITTPILFHTLACELPRRAVFLVQREVAERAMSPPGSKTYGALSVNLQVLTQVERVFDIPPGAFRPPPKVDSSVIRLTPLVRRLISQAEQPSFRSFVQSVFGQRRKQLGTILRGMAEQTAPTAAETDRRETGYVGVLDKVDIDPTERPERLTPTQFVQLFRAVRESKR
jgi:16S rRNA (adenine1518-N6/adenine1519-N6)-dimethyltransferase